MPHVILVDENDNQIGTGEKLDVHQKGLLHRCFSICVFNQKGEMMLQQRDKNKYHSGGLWTNTCCRHPESDEDTEAAALRRLKEDLGFDCDLEEVFSFNYRAPLDNGITEHEFDHTFFGFYDGEPTLNPEEAMNWKWMSLDNLQAELEKKPQEYTYWLKEMLPKVIELRKNEKTTSN